MAILKAGRQPSLHTRRPRIHPLRPSQDPSPPPDDPRAGRLELELPDRFNFRDLGGFTTADGARVAQGRLFRGASLHHLQPEELERFHRLGMRTVIDLRTPHEWSDETAPPLPGLGARSLPLIERLPKLPADPEDSASMLTDLYMWVLEVGAGTIAAVLELLASEDSYPFAFYCAAGKDRTGVVTAIVFGLLGVPREQIVGDYRSSDGPVDELKRWHEERRPARYDPVPAGAYRALAQTMEDFLDRVDERYGGVPGYLREIGVPTEVDAAIAAQLLDR